MDITNKNILVIAPHADDAEVGMGGTIHKLSESNEVAVLVLSLPPKVDEDVVTLELLAALKDLNVHAVFKNHLYDPQNMPADVIRNKLYYTASTKQYDIIFCPNSKDVHQSHKLVYEETRRTFKHTTILGYEAPWNSFGFDNQVYITVTLANLEAKKLAISRYKTQMDRVMFSRDLSYELASIRGQQCGTEYAECFEAIRIII